MMPTINSTPLRDVIYMFSIAKDIPDADLLDQFTRKYPEHAKELTDFAISLALDTVLQEDDAQYAASSESVSPAVSRVMSRFQNHMFAMKQAGYAASSKAKVARSTPIDNPFLRH